MKHAILVILLLTATLSGCATLPPETRSEEIAYQVITAVDFTQTLHAADEPNRFQEHNPLIGEHPTPTKVVGYFAVTMSAHYAITSLLVANNAPTWAVRTWEGLSIGFETSCVANNIHQGVTPTLSFTVRK